MSYDFKYEHFKSIYDFEKTINSRKINECYANREKTSQREDYEWFNTTSYEEAQNLLMQGWNIEVQNMVEELNKFKRIIDVKKNRRIKSINGFVPIVPNAIKGMPLSMYNTKIEQQKKRKNSVHIIINNTANGSISSHQLMKSGITCLKLAYVLDRMGIRTKIDVIPKMAISGESCYGCSVSIKDYRQPFNLSKMAYPLAHTSFFRRHGFKFYETMEGFTNSSMASNYGQSLIYYKGERIVDEYKKYAGFMKDDVVYIDFYDVKNANFDYKALAESKGIKLS